jgi:hypothetical protein
MATASSVEVHKNFGRYKDTALAEPVVVTQYGKRPSRNSVGMAKCRLFS